MPVKVLSDQANRTYVREGYKGLRYAMENGADIICLAWSGGNPAGRYSLANLGALDSTPGSTVFDFRLYSFNSPHIY